jgi:hypothetical protein
MFKSVVLDSKRERKYEEVARNFNMLETDLLKAMLRSSHKISKNRKVSKTLKK